MDIAALLLAIAGAIGAGIKLATAEGGGWYFNNESGDSQ